MAQLLLPAGRVLWTWPAGPTFVHLFCLSIGLRVPTYHVHNNRVTYIVAMHLCSTLL